MAILEDLDVKWQEAKINQICEVVRNIEKRTKEYWEKFGFGPWYFWDFFTPDLYDYYYRGVKVEDAAFRIALAQIGPIQYELTQPLYGIGIHQEFLEKRGEGVHHLKIYYEDIPKAKELFKKKGIYVLQEGKYKDDWHVFLDTEKQYGIIWEIGNCKNIGPPDKVYPPKNDH